MDDEAMKEILDAVYKQAVEEADKLLIDLMMCGIAITKDGKRVPPESLIDWAKVHQIEKEHYWRYWD